MFAEVVSLCLEELTGKCRNLSFRDKSQLNGPEELIRLRSFLLHKYAKGQMPMAVTRRIPMHMNKGKNHFPESGRQNGLCEESGEDGQR